VGGSDEIPVDVRVVAATNRDLGQQVARGEFRADLYYRLNVVRLEVPPLRERGRDVELLAEHLSRVIAERYAEPPRPFKPDARALIAAYSWPGNVRELRNAIERAYAIGAGTAIAAADLPAELRAGSGLGGSPAPATAGGTPAGTQAITGFQDAKRHVIGDFERAFLSTALARAGGNVTLAAERAGVLRQVFQRMLIRHGIGHEQFRDVTRARGRQPD
jgi:two-component system response regulator GlrR